MIKTTTATVTTAGTRQRLVATSTMVTGYVIRAQIGNTGSVYMGDNTVSSSSPALEQGAANTFTANNTNPPVDLYDIYIDAANSADGFDIFYNEME